MNNHHTINSKIFSRDFIFANSIKRHICDVRNSRLGHDIRISVNNRVILPFREGFNFTKLRMRSFAKIKTLAKNSEFTVYDNLIDCCNDFISSSSSCCRSSSSINVTVQLSLYMLVSSAGRFHPCIRTVARHIVLFTWAHVFWWKAKYLRTYAT